MDVPERGPTELGSDMETSCEVCGCTASCGTWHDKKSKSWMRLCLGCAIELGLWDDTGERKLSNEQGGRHAVRNEET